MKNGRPVTAAYATEALCISQQVYLCRPRHQISVSECPLLAESSRS